VTDAGLALYPLWDLTHPAVPARSRLFHLAPIGVGTAAVESLTGYLARLAEAHRVLPRELMIQEIFPLLGRPGLMVPSQGQAMFWSRETYALNGIGPLADDVARGLEALTRRRDVRFLTLRPWAAVIPAKGLLRHTWAWCPACYADWQQAGTPVYEPLLWALRLTTLCPRHCRRLQQVCPSPACRRARPPLARGSRPGHCPGCGGWLGQASTPDPDAAVTDAEVRAQIWVQEVVGELLASAPDLPLPPAPERIVRTLGAYVERVGGGNLSALARELDLCMVTLASWRQGRALPSLELLAHTCHRLGTTPRRFLTGDHDAGEPTPANPVVLTAKRRRTAPRRPFDAAEARAALEAALASDRLPPPSVAEVARQLGHHPTHLQQQLPELCRAISARHRAHQKAKGLQRRHRLCGEVRQAAYRLHAEGLYPSLHRVASLLSQPGFIRNAAAAETWREALRELGGHS
jgi:transposase-like protein